MAFTVTINYGSGDVALTNYSGENLVYAGSLKKTTQVHSKDFRPVSGQAWFSIQPKPALMSALFALDRDQLITVSIMDGATPWFTGYVRPLTKFKDSTGKTSVDFECVDAGWPLHLKPSVDVQYVPADNMVVCNTSSTSVSLIHQLLLDAGFTGSVSAFNIAESIGYLRVVNKPFFEVLSDLCFSYHASFYFDDAGGFVLYDWGKTSGSISSSGTVDEDNMLGELSIDRSTDIPDTPIVVYMEQSSQAGVDLGSLSPSPVVIADSTDISTHGTPMVWNGRTGSKGLVDFVNTRTFIVSHKPAPENFDGIISTSVTLTRIQGSNFVNDTPYDRIDLAGGRYLKTFPLTTTPTVVTWNLRDVITVSGTFTKTTATWAYNNAVNDGICNRIEKVAVSGNCAVSIEAGRVTGPEIGSGTKDYTARYLYDETLAETLATAISENLRYGEYKYSWRSIENLTVGNYYTVANTLASVSSLVRVTKKTININPSGDIFYEYEGTRYSGFATVTVAADPGYQSEVIIVEEDEDTQVIEGPEMPEAADISLSATGLYLTKDKMGYYDASAADWKAVINNDGTFKFDGDGSSFIEWDGSSLSIAGDLALSGSSTLAGTITAGKDVQSSNYSAGSEGWKITGNGDAEFNTLTVRDEDIQDALVGEVVDDIADFECAVPYWMTVVKLDGSGVSTSWEASTANTGVFSTAQYNRYPKSLFSSAGNDEVEYLNGKYFTENQSGLVWGGFIWIYVSALGSVSKPFAWLASSTNLEISSTGKVLVTDSGTSPTTWGTTAASVSTGQWSFISAWIDVDLDELYISINGTKETFDISGVANMYRTQRVTGGLGYNGVSSLVLYASEAGTLSITDGTDPEPVLEQYRTSTNPWSERFKPHAFNVAPEINSSEAILPPGWLYGLETSAATDTDHDVTVARGKARDSKDRRNILLNDPITKRIDATWAVGTDAGGLFYGTVAANTTYHLFVVRKDSDGTVDVGFDTSVSAANIPSGYTAYRRIRSYVTDASANIIQTKQNGDTFILQSPITRSYSGSTVPTSATTISANTPTGLELIALLNLSLNEATAEAIRVCSLYETLGAVGIGNASVMSSANGQRNNNNLEVLTDSSGNIQIRSSNAVTLDTFNVNTLGWVDPRGRFGGV
jgi:hypothetical protein